MTCSPYPWRIKQLCFLWETSAKWRQTSCLRVPRRHGTRGGKVWTMEPWRWDRWQWRSIKKRCVFMHISKYIVLYFFSLWFDTLSSVCRSSLWPRVAASLGGKWTRGSQDARGEILLSAPPGCLLTVATVLRRIRSPAGECHASLSGSTSSRSRP